MDKIHNDIDEYLIYCEAQKRLDIKTIKAYKIDLIQFSNKYNSYIVTDIKTIGRIYRKSS